MTLTIPKLKTALKGQRLSDTVCILGHAVMILMSIPEEVVGGSSNVLYSRSTNQPRVVLCKETTFKAIGTPVKVVISGTSRTKGLPDIVIFHILENYT